MGRVIAQQILTTEVAFWVMAPIIVALALGMVFARKTVHSALCLVGVMVALGVLYASLSAPFLFVAQLIVYTGSVMMLFLFTMMLIGIDTTEQMRETIKGQRVAAIVAAVGLAALLIVTVGHGVVGTTVGVDSLNDQAGGNAQALANVLFGRFAMAFEAASALVITAALAAMVLSHADRVTPRERQHQRVTRRLREYAAEGIPPTPDPSPGVYAQHNAATYPALMPNREPAPDSVAAALRARGQDVVGGPALIVPVGQLHNQLAQQAEDLGGVPSLRAVLTDDKPVLEAPASPVAEPPLAEHQAEPQDQPPVEERPARPRRGEL